MFAIGVSSVQQPLRNEGGFAKTCSCTLEAVAVAVIRGSKAKGKRGSSPHCNALRNCSWMTNGQWKYCGLHKPVLWARAMDAGGGVAQGGEGTTGSSASWWTINYGTYQEKGILKNPRTKQLDKENMTTAGTTWISSKFDHHLAPQDGATCHFQVEN